MTEMEPGQTGIENLLRRSMAAPVPTLPPDFDQRLMRELRPASPSLARYRRILLTGYGLVSIVTCAVVMQGQGFGWGAIALLTLSPLALVQAVSWARRYV